VKDVFKGLHQAYNAVDNAIRMLEEIREFKLSGELYKIRVKIGERHDRVAAARMKKKKRKG